jgi:hypothetical protein
MDVLQRAELVQYDVAMTGLLLSQVHDLMGINGATIGDTR